jgi:hypothetical protein
MLDLFCQFREGEMVPQDSRYLSAKGIIELEFLEFVKKQLFFVSNLSCYLLEIHEFLRSNEGEISIALDEEKTHGRQNYSDILPVRRFVASDPSSRELTKSDE